MVCVVCLVLQGYFRGLRPTPFIGPYNIVGKVANKYPCQ